ncbi:MAG: patatin-like phospholipase family protein [Actinobacteria bacterium]|nr:patatin-like phospholipase family protein [Actinomycetota bacterium]
MDETVLYRRQDATAAPAARRGLAGPRAEKVVSLALQGGGAHGAFTWGVLDALLEDGRLAVDAITGASAGAMNAVVMVQGWLEDGPDGARAALATFWRRASVDGYLSPTQRRLLRRMLGLWRAETLTTVITHSLSPYQTNPLNINPLRHAIGRLVDFDRVRACTDVEVYLSATNVWTGAVEIFTREELTADHLMASACLPQMFQAVEIDGVPYWDGGYMGNPALFPLLYQSNTEDILLVQINPMERRHTPRTARQIRNRLNEITFNSNLLRELRAVAFVQQLIEEGKLSAEDYKNVHLHRIDGAGLLDAHQASSRRKAEWDFFVQLRDAGRRAAGNWLAAHYSSVGERGTVDLRAVLR